MSSSRNQSDVAERQLFEALDFLTLSVNPEFRFMPRRGSKLSDADNHFMKTLQSFVSSANDFLASRAHLSAIGEVTEDDLRDFMQYAGLDYQDILPPQPPPPPPGHQPA